MLAWVGRYGHQPVDTLRQLPLYELQTLGRCLHEIVEEENRYSDGMQRLGGD